MAALQSEETQLNGMVCIAYNIDEYKDAKRGQGWFEMADLGNAIPMYYAAIHYTCNDMANYVLVNVVLKVAPEQRARFQIHFGSHLECQYILSTYGITAECLPFTQETNNIDLKHHQRWLNERLEKEMGVPAAPAAAAAHQSSVDIISEPNPNDVLFVRGKTSNNPGNQYLRMLIKELSQAYNVSGSNKQKRRLVDGMIAKILESGGRFLEESKGGGQQQPCCWREVSMEEARTKIMQSFRNHRHRADKLKSKSQDGNLIDGEPLPDDVVFGRGPRSRGSELLLVLVKDRSEEYEAMDRGLKLHVVDAVMEKIAEAGGRFLQPLPEAGTWVEVPHEAARERVSKYFRNLRRSRKTKAR